ARNASTAHVLGGEKIAGGSGRRSAGKNELVRGKAGALVGLKHAIAEGVLLGQSEVRLNAGWVDIHELRVGMRIGRTIGGWTAWDQVRAVHFAAVIHGDEGGMGVAQIVILRVG